MVFADMYVICRHVRNFPCPLGSSPIQPAAMTCRLQLAVSRQPELAGSRYEQDIPGWARWCHPLHMYIGSVHVPGVKWLRAISRIQSRT